MFRKPQLNFINNPFQGKTQIIITCYWRWLVCEQIMSEDTTTKEKAIKQKIPKIGGRNKDNTNQG